MAARAEQAPDGEGSEFRRPPLEEGAAFMPALQGERFRGVDATVGLTPQPAAAKISRDTAEISTEERGIAEIQPRRTPTILNSLNIVAQQTTAELPVWRRNAIWQVADCSCRRAGEQRCAPSVSVTSQLTPRRRRHMFACSCMTVGVPCGLHSITVRDRFLRAAGPIDRCKRNLSEHRSIYNSNNNQSRNCYNS